MGGALVRGGARRAKASRRRRRARLAFSRWFGPFVLGLVIAVSADHARAARARRLAEMDQQLRRPDHDLRDAGLGPEHRGRPRRPARSRLRRLLRRRRLFLCAAVDDLRPVVLDLPAARRHARRDVGRHPRLSGAAAARRLSRHRDARLRRNHPPRAHQLGRLHQRLRRHLRHPARHASSAFRSPTTTTASPRSSICPTRRSTARSSSSI